MAGETIKAAAICLDVRPWSRTSHVVVWLTPAGKVTTVVKGAVRSKSLFLGQYDLNYTCEILYYAGARRGVHALRDCAPVAMRERLRGDHRALTLAGYCRKISGELAPSGRECEAWFAALGTALDRCEALAAGGTPGAMIAAMLGFEIEILRLLGLAPDFSGFDQNAEWSAFSLEKGAFSETGRRCVRVPLAAARYLASPDPEEENLKHPLDAARVIGVFYQFHLESASDVRRSVLGVISGKKEGNA